LRFQGRSTGVDEAPPPQLLEYIVGTAKYFSGNVERFRDAGSTRRERLQELQRHLGVQFFTAADYRGLAVSITTLAMQTWRGVVLAEALINEMRRSLVNCRTRKFRAAYSKQLHSQNPVPEKAVEPGSTPVQILSRRELRFSSFVFTPQSGRVLVKLIIIPSRKTFALFKKRRLNTLYRRIRVEKTWSVKPQNIEKNAGRVLVRS
jgi:Domain of unknown function (DUF4158)